MASYININCWTHSPVHIHGTYMYYCFFKNHIIYWMIFFSVSEVHCSYVYKPYITYVYTEIYTISVYVTTHYPYPSPSPGEKNSVFINISLELINFYTEDKFPFHFITSHFLEMAFHWQPSVLPSVNSFLFWLCNYLTHS